MDYPYARNILANHDRHEMLFSDPQGPQQIVMELCSCSALLAAVPSMGEIFGDHRPWPPFLDRKNKPTFKEMSAIFNKSGYIFRDGRSCSEARAVNA
jgi:hypothetical protein